MNESSLPRATATASAKGLRQLACGVGVACLLACGGPAPKAPNVSSDETLAADWLAARKLEAHEESAAAINAYLALLERAAQAPAGHEAVLAGAAALDALALRSVAAFTPATSRSALLYRTPGHLAAAEKRMQRLVEGPGHPVVRHLVARALSTLMEYHGLAGPAERLRAASGCMHPTWITGPVAWSMVDATDRPPMVGLGRVPQETPGPLGTPAAGYQAGGGSCAIWLGAASAQGGTRELVVDAEAPAPTTFTLVLHGHVPASIYLDGQKVATRSYDRGGRDTTTYATAEVTAGVHRVVVRVATNSNEQVELAWLGAARFLESPAVAITGKVTQVAPQTLAPSQDPARRMLRAAGQLALGDGPLVEAIGDLDHPAAGLLQAAALATAEDLSSVDQAEKMRAAYERTLKGWPNAWEALIEHAELAGRRRAPGEANFQALRDLEAHRKADTPLLSLYQALLATRERLHDQRAKSLAGASTLADTHLHYAVLELADDTSTQDRTRRLCQAAAWRDYASESCVSALTASGQRADAEREYNRLTTLRGDPLRHRFALIRMRLAEGNYSGAQALLQDLPPGERTLAVQFLVDKSDAKSRMAQLAKAWPVADGGIGALPPLLRYLGQDVAKPYEDVGRALVEADRKSPVMPGGGAVLLRHDEHYELDASGLLHYVLYDIRRLSSTTDVEENAQVTLPRVFGEDTLRTLRRRILKKDGRVLDPEETPNAAQAHADLSQLEAGDYVESLFDGYAIPDESWELGFDSPDLLPERTSVVRAKLEVSLPQGVGTFYAHALLGKPEERREGARITRVYKLENRPVRRREDGVPIMDQSVGVSFSTLTWRAVSQSLVARMTSLTEPSGEVNTWAENATRALGDRKTVDPKKLIAAVVERAGQDIKQALPGVLGDFGVHGDGFQSVTARTFLGTREGSRSWLILQALRALGLRAELRLAEPYPYSAHDDFPPHRGRFSHPLVVAYANADTIWIDADIPGPPLPPGHVSPELRGRKVLDPLTSTLGDLPRFAEESERDEVDVRLALDVEGHAKGDFTILLRGRAAQELAEALIKLVGVERDKALRSVVLGWLPYATVDDVALSSAEGSWQVAIRANISVRNYAQREGTRWVLPGIDAVHEGFPRRYNGTLIGTYAGLGARENDLAINRASQYHLRRRVTLAHGFAVARVPSAFEVRAAGLIAAKRKAEIKGSLIEEDFTLDVGTGTVAGDAVEALRRDLGRADDGFLASTWLNGPAHSAGRAQTGQGPAAQSGSTPRH
jgi:hypothetical protein